MKSSRLASNWQSLCGGQSLHLIDHGSGQYPLEHLRDLPLLDRDGNVVTVIGGRTGVRGKTGFVEGYRTDLASIPTRALKKLLEPQRRKPWAGEEIKGDWIVYIWRENDDGTLSPDSWFRDPIAYAAVFHDWGYSLEMEPRGVVDGRFLEILTIGEVWSRYIMWLSVRAGGWPSYPHAPAEVSDDRLLAAQALDRWTGLDRTGMRIG